MFLFGSNYVWKIEIAITRKTIGLSEYIVRKNRLGRNNGGIFQHKI